MEAEAPKKVTKKSTSVRVEKAEKTNVKPSKKSQPVEPVAKPPAVKPSAAKQPVAKPPAVKPPVAKPPAVKQPVVSPLEIAISKYKESGWEIIIPPKGSINDFIAKRKDRFHFVQIVTKATIDDAKFHGEAKNSFVQNAFSNGATPIFAHYANSKVTLEDVNTSNRVLISTRKKNTPGESVDE